MTTKKSSRILEAVYETAHDLHRTGLLAQEQIQAYQAIAPLSEPVYLDADVIEYLNEKCQNNTDSLRVLVNDLLRKDIEIARRVAV
jgi:hypothetical protein